jgi:hypothetical protein
MTITLRKAAAGLAVLAASTLAGAAPAIATNSRTQPKGPPQYSGNPASVPGQNVVGNGAAVLHCNSPANGGSPGVTVDNKNGFHNNNPGQSC